MADITAGLDYTCAVMNYGQVMCWGNNDRWQLANGTTTDSTVPVLASLITGISKVDAGLDKSCGLTSTGLLRCLNNSKAQELGGLRQSPNSSLEVAVNRFGPVVVGLNAEGIPVTFRAGTSQEVNNVNHSIDVDSGLGHLCALQNDGTVKCWGSNYYGQLGTNTQASNPDPQPVVNLSAAWQLAVGKYHACVMITNNKPATDDDIQCWGLNMDGQLGDGTYINSPIPVFVK